MKKLISTILICAIVTAGGALSTFAEAASTNASGSGDIELPFVPVDPNHSDTDTSPKKMVGDADGDMSVTSQDALMLLQASAGMKTLEVNSVTDVDGNGWINSNDALNVLRYSVGLSVMPGISIGSLIS